MKSFQVRVLTQWLRHMVCCHVVVWICHVTLATGYEEDTQDGGRSLQSLLQSVILGQQQIQKRHQATDWSMQESEDLYDDQDYYFSEPYNGLIYTKRKEPAFSEEYDTVQHTSSSLLESRRQNRQAVVDLLVLVDHTVYQEYLKTHDNNRKKAIRSIKRYYTLLVSMIDSRYREIDSTKFGLRIRPAAVIVVEYPSAFQWETGSLGSWENADGEEETVMDPHRALAYLHTWLQTHGNLPNYDHVMAFTRYNLVKPGKHRRPSSGMAYISTMCQTEVAYSVSVISEKGGFANVETATHELAHSLGATHDGGPENKACPASDGHIMAPAQALKEHYGPNYFTFSSCSIKSFQKMLESEQASCLYDSEPEKSSSKLPGDFYSPDKQCKHVFGPLSGECKVPGIQREELICQNLWCRDPSDTYGCITRSGLHAVYGTPCDVGKMCYNGNCMPEDIMRENSRTENKHNVLIQDKGQPERGHNEASDEKHKLILKTQLSKDSKDSQGIIKGEENSLTSAEENDVTDSQYLQRQDYGKSAEDINHDKTSDEIFNAKTAADQLKQKESSVELSARLRVPPRQPHPGDRRYLAHSGKSRAKQQTPRVIPSTQASTDVAGSLDTTTESTTRTPTTSEALPTASPCAKDKSASYCRSLIYTNGASICEMDTLATYCCHTCSYYG